MVKNYTQGSLVIYSLKKKMQKKLEKEIEKKNSEKNNWKKIYFFLENFVWIFFLEKHLHRDH